MQFKIRYNDGMGYTVRETITARDILQAERYAAMEARHEGWMVADVAPIIEETEIALESSDNEEESNG